MHDGSSPLGLPSVSVHTVYLASWQRLTYVKLW
jgi:hypothetical protein